MSPPHVLRALIGARARVGTVTVGDVRGVILDRAQTRVLGLEIVGTDRASRFLPWVAVEADPAGGVWARSAFFLLDELESYERRGAVVLHAVPDDDPREVSGEGAIQVSRVSRGLEPGTADGMDLPPASPAKEALCGGRLDAARSA